MRIFNQLIGAAFFAILVTVGVNAQEEMAMEGDEADLTLEMSLDYASKYIFRGQQRNDEPVLQSNVTLGYGDFGFDWWGNYALTDTAQNGREDNFSEYQWTVFYGSSTGDLEWQVGAIEYYFPGTGDGEDNDTREVYTSVGYNVILNPTLTVYYDFEEAHGFYGVFSIGHGWILDDDEQWEFSLGTSIAYASSDYNEHYFGVNDDGWNDVNVSATLSCAVNENFNIYYSLNYAEIVGEDVEDGADATYNDSDNIWFVWGAAYTF